MVPAKKQIDGMFLIIDRKNPRGLRHWSDELLQRQIPAVIQVDEYMLDTHCALIKSLADSGFAIAGVNNERPFWNQPYDYQYSEMNRIKEKVQACTGKPMRLFASKYAAHDEQTVKAANKLGISYIFIRGPVGARAVVFKPQEYNVKLLSQSNVPLRDAGTGSLCDESLFCRGAVPADMREILFNLDVGRIILVAQTHLSGVKLNWWNLYQDFFKADIVRWLKLDDFSVEPVVLPYAEIPVNRAVEYTTPKPAIPIEMEPDFSLLD